MRNTITGIGYLVEDPTVRVTSTNKKVATFRMCLSPSDAQDKAYIDVQVWERQAEIAEEYLVKGRELYIEGELRLRTWNDEKTGKTASRFYIACKQFTFLNSGKKKSDEEGDVENSKPATKQNKTKRKATVPASDEVSDDEIPF